MHKHTTKLLILSTILCYNRLRFIKIIWAKRGVLYSMAKKSNNFKVASYKSETEYNFWLIILFAYVAIGVAFLYVTGLSSSYGPKKLTNESGNLFSQKIAK